MRFPVRKRQEPGANHIDSVGYLAGHQSLKLAAIFGRHNTGGMIGKSCQHRDFVSGFGPVAGEFGGTGGRSAHLWRKILGNVEDLHAKLEAISFGRDQDRRRLQVRGEILAEGDNRPPHPVLAERTAGPKA